MNRNINLTNKDKHMKNIIETTIPIFLSVVCIFFFTANNLQAATVGGSIGINDNTTTIVKPSTPENLTVESIDGETEITITWNEVSDATSYNLYRFQEVGGNMQEDEKISNLTDSSYTDSGLNDGVYAYKVESVNGDLSSDKTEFNSFITIEESTPSDDDSPGDDSSDGSTSDGSTPSGSTSGGGGGQVADPPNISNIQVSVATSSVDITWETDEDSYTWIEYGLSTDLNQEVQIEEYSQSHNVSLEGLESDTNYYYKIKAIDRDDDVANYTIEGFRTLVDEDEENEPQINDETNNNNLEQRVLGEKVVNERNQQILDIETDAASVFEGIKSKVLNNSQAKEDTGKEDGDKGRYVNDLLGDEDLSEDKVKSMNYFITYGTKTTLRLGKGERAGVIDSYKSAFGKLPQTEEEWQDAIKIANGRWPSERSEEAENRASDIFKEVYNREADMDNPNDNAAVTIIAYGLRPDNRNLESEKTAIDSFEYIYDTSPNTAIHWDVVRAIAYSGATR